MYSCNLIANLLFWKRYCVEPSSYEELTLSFPLKDLSPQDSSILYFYGPVLLASKALRTAVLVLPSFDYSLE